MPSNPSNFQNIVPLSQSFVVNRVGVSQVTLGPFLDINGNTVAFDSATEFELWVAAQDQALPITVAIQKLTPFLPLLWTPGGGAPYHNTVIMRISKDDIDALGIGAGNLSYQLICSKDSGVTVDQVASGVMTIPQFLTSGW